jgi:hypothetical protein
MRSFSTGWIREGLTNQNSAVIVLVGLITTKKGTCCRQFAFSSQMITKIGDAKSVCCSRRGQSGKSSAKCRMDQKPFRRPKN